MNLILRRVHGVIQMLNTHIPEWTPTLPAGSPDGGTLSCRTSVGRTPSQIRPGVVRRADSRARACE